MTSKGLSLSTSSTTKTKERATKKRPWGGICRVPTCKLRSQSDPNVRFFRMPDRIKNKDKFEKWLQICGISNLPPLQNAYICCKHFRPEDIGKRKLKLNRLPSLNVPFQICKDNVDLHDNSDLNCDIKNNEDVDKEQPGIFYSEYNEKATNSWERIRCIIPSCMAVVKDYPERRFFQFPKRGTDIHKKWMTALAEFTDIIALHKHPYVCSSHFDKSAIGRRFLKTSAIPKLNLKNSCSSIISSYNNNDCNEAYSLFIAKHGIIGCNYFPSTVNFLSAADIFSTADANIATETSTSSSITTDSIVIENESNYYENEFFPIKTELNDNDKSCQVSDKHFPNFNNSKKSKEFSCQVSEFDFSVKRFKEISCQVSEIDFIKKEQEEEEQEAEEEPDAGEVHAEEEEQAKEDEQAEEEEQETEDNNNFSLSMKLTKYAPFFTAITEFSLTH